MRAFTLIEILVSIAIFSGLMVVSIAIFARSATSSTQANAVREQTQVARSVIDQIANDMRYVDRTKSLVDLDCEVIPVGSAWTGFCPVISLPDSLRLVIKYPGQSLHTIKTYYLTSSDTPDTYQLLVTEKRDCDLTVPASCLPTQAGQSVLTSGYSLEYPVSESLFDAQPKRGSSSAFAKLSVTVKPSSVEKCADDAGSCYQLTTTLVPGGY